MFSMNVIREAIEGNKNLTYLVLIIGFFSYITFFVFMYSKPYSSDVNFYMMLFSPFAVLQGCGAYFLGHISIGTITHKHFKITKIILSTFFIIASITYISMTYTGHLSDKFSWLFRFIMPVLFINFLLATKDLITKSKILKYIGNYSFPIYIIHPIICTASFIICNKYFCTNIASALIIQLLTVVASYHISVLCFKIPLLKKKLFPRTPKDITSTH